MLRLIENLRNRPESHRHVIAVGVSFLVTLAIAGIWIMTVLPGNVSSVRATGTAVLAEKNQRVQAIKSEQGQVAKFRANLAQSFSAIRVQWDSINSYFGKTDYEAPVELQVISPEQKKLEL